METTDFGETFLIHYHTEYQCKQQGRMLELNFDLLFMLVIFTHMCFQAI